MPQKFNAAVRDGSAAKKLGRIVEESKPEAAYSTAQDGKRGGHLTSKFKEASELPKLARALVSIF
jgi:hypothetical protein